MSNIKLSETGSEWRRWDLHVHTPNSFHNEFKDWETYKKKLKEKAIYHDIEVVGINDYFSIDGYEELLTMCEEDTVKTNPRIKLDNSKWLYLMPVIELRLDIFNSETEAVNIHIIFSPELLPSTIKSSFIEKLQVTYQGKKLNCKKEDLIKIGHAEENSGNFNINLDLSLINPTEQDRLKNIALRAISFSSAVFEDGIKDFEKILQDSGINKNKYLIIIANKGRGGLDSFKWKDKVGNTSKSGLIRQNLLRLSQICFSNDSDDIDFLLGKNKDTNKEEIINRFGSLKACVWGSDAHDEEKIFHPSNGNTDGYTWIKSDPSFEGLQQIIYEPESGERVYIGPIKPDQKDDYKVISRIKFIGSSDFPELVNFNNNLSSIIGSRSSGKSALLAYVAHSINPEMTEKINKHGPGNGEDFTWEKTNTKCIVEWANGKENKDSPGNMVYIPQNFLFENSQNPNEIKNKIEPILFKTKPDIESKYKQTIIDINTINNNISDKVDDWFVASDSLGLINKKIKDEGDKKSIETQKTETELKIKLLKEKNNFDENDIKSYKEIKIQASGLLSRNKEIDKELSIISNTSKEIPFFQTITIITTPSLSLLPTELNEHINESIKNEKELILKNINEKVLEYKQKIEKEKIDNNVVIEKIKTDNKDLIDKYNKNVELDSLLKSLNNTNDSLKRIELLEKEKIAKGEDLTKIETEIKESIYGRKTKIDFIVTEIQKDSGDTISGIKFGAECGLDDKKINILEQKINLRNNTYFVEGRNLFFDKIRNDSSRFINDIYNENQKTNSGQDKKEVVKYAFELTEDILFTANMEGDKIGGFSESTMTPGKRALFALRLILAESNDTWPLLIDQPEDDLDSRSIYEEVVPFIKQKKKERQIIMVSHNANLVIGVDSEEIIIANRNGDDRPNEDKKQFNYLTGSLEFSNLKNNECKDTLMSQGVCEHTCSILDGGKAAFENRKNKYKI